MTSIRAAISIAICQMLLAGCSSSTGPTLSGASASAAVVPTQPVNLDRHCDLAPFPSADWTACELANFARTGEAPAEQLSAGFQQRFTEQSVFNLQEWTARATADPSWLSPLSGNTLVLPLCATWSLQCVGDPFRFAQASGPDGAPFYKNEAEVTPIMYYDRDCARQSGHVWLPKSAPTGAKLPNIVITNGSIQAPETVYWWAVQPLVRAGYAVMTYDPRGQGRSDQQTPTLLQGSNANLKVFWEGQVDAIDFFHSTPTRPYPYNVSCAGTYPTPTTPFNPIWDRIDPTRLGIAGHSAGAIGVSVVQGYDPWPGKIDSANPAKAVVAWDSLIAPDGSGFAPVNDFPIPPELYQLALLVGSEGNPPLFPAPRVPALSFNADYAVAPAPYVLPPDPEAHKIAFAAWQSAGVPTYVVGFQGTTHFDYSLLPTFPTTSWCPDTSSGACRGGWGSPAIVHYTLAWFDRWLKNPGESGYADADARLLDDGGPDGAVKMSFHYRSARNFPDRGGHPHHCEDIRAGCTE